MPFSDCSKEWRHPQVLITKFFDKLIEFRNLMLQENLIELYYD